MERDDMGGLWKGDERSRTARRYGPEELEQAPPPKKGIIAPTLLVIVALALFVAGFALLTSYLAVAVGEGWLLLALSVAIALGLPIAVALWAIRPMEGRQAFMWWWSVFAAPYLLTTAGLSLGVPDRTAAVLDQHGAWPARLAAGKNSPTAKKAQKLATWAASLLSGIDESTGEPEENVTPERAQKPDDRKPATPKKVRYAGRKWLSFKRTSLPRDRSRRRGVHVKARFKGGAIFVYGRVEPTRRRGDQKATFLVDPNATRTIFSPQAAARLGLPATEKSPMIQTDAGSGEGRYPAVVVSRISLGKASVRNLTCVVCGPCVVEGVSGVLGKNFLRHYIASVDRGRQTLTLTPRRRKVDRAVDVEPFVEIADPKAVQTGKKLRITGRVGNRGSRPIEDLRIDGVLLRADDSAIKRISTTLEKLEPGKFRPFEIEGDAPDHLDSFMLEAASARW
jgi:hypothetical protein